MPVRRVELGPLEVRSPGNIGNARLIQSTRRGDEEFCDHLEGLACCNIAEPDVMLLSIVIPARRDKFSLENDIVFDSVGRSDAFLRRRNIRVSLCRKGGWNAVEQRRTQ